MKRLLMLLLLLSLGSALAIPPLPTDFFGTVTIFDANRTRLPIGTRIDIYAGNVTCGTYTVSNPGYYGLFTCLGDDNYTEIDEGAEYGQNIIFRLNNQTPQVFGDTVWYNGEFHSVNITPVPRCGNGWCELTESCIICQEDCGRCPINFSGNGSLPFPPPPVPGGGSGGGGGGGGAGGNAVGFGQGFANESINLSFVYCEEDWFCTAWAPEICPVEEVQTRKCTDRKRCGTYYLLPESNQSCEYIGTCFDYIINQDETDIDCGGLVCGPCDLGRRCRYDFDCKSDFCNPVDSVCAEPTCTDGFKNQGEEGVDCGGPCPLCERPTIEKPETVVKFMVKGCGSFPWLFVALATLFSVLAYIMGKLYIRSQGNSRAFRLLSKLDQLIRIYNLERDLHAFVLIIILLEVAISLYYYYLCELGVWLIVIFLVIIPLIIAVLIKSYYYDERRKKERLRKTILRHEDYLRRLVQLERTEIRKEEKIVFDILSDLDYKRYDNDLALLLKDIRFMLKELLSTKDEEPLDLENSLVDAISLLATDKFQKMADQDLTQARRDMAFIEKIHRDILLQYKSLREDKDIEEQLEAEEPDTGPVKEERPKDREIMEKMDSPGDKEGYLDSISKTDDPVTLFKAASQYHKQGLLDKAEQLYLRLIQADPANVKAMYYLASLYNLQKKQKKSLELYSRIMKIKPDFMNTKAYYEKLKKAIP